MPHWSQVGIYVTLHRPVHIKQSPVLHHCSLQLTLSLRQLLLLCRRTCPTSSLLISSMRDQYAALRWWVQHVVQVTSELLRLIGLLLVQTHRSWLLLTQNASVCCQVTICTYSASRLELYLKLLYRSADSYIVCCRLEVLRACVGWLRAPAIRSRTEWHSGPMPYTKGDCLSQRVLK